MSGGTSTEHLHFDVEGSEALPALVLIHGFMSSSLQWSPNREALREHFRLVAVDLWGHGRSPSPAAAEAYRVERYVDELERIRKGLGGQPWYVCGQSFGAGIAIRYALARPQAVRGLIITNSRSALNGVRPEEGDRGLDFWKTVDVRKLPYHPVRARRFPPHLQERMVDAADALDRHALWQATATTTIDLCCRDVVEMLEVPTLLVNGRYEKSFQADRDFAAASVPGIEVVDLDAGHSVNIEDAGGFDRAVIDFAARRH